MNAELLNELANFDTGEATSSPVGTRIRSPGTGHRQCVAFESLVEGQRFYVEARSDSYLTRTSRPLSRCPRFVNTFVWVNCND